MISNYSIFLIIIVYASLIRTIFCLEDSIIKNSSDKNKVIINSSSNDTTINNFTVINSSRNKNSSNQALEVIKVDRVNYLIN